LLSLFLFAKMILRRNKSSFYFFGARNKIPNHLYKSLTEFLKGGEQNKNKKPQKSWSTALDYPSNEEKGTGNFWFYYSVLDSASTSNYGLLGLINLIKESHMRSSPAIFQLNKKFFSVFISNSLTLNLVW